MRQEREYEKYKQCIVVYSDEKKMNLYDNGELIRTINDVVIGKNGCTDQKIEGDGCTPLGKFSIGFAFGLEDLSIDYPYYKITSNAYFVSDSNSKFYNMWVFLEDKAQDYPYDYMKTSSDVLWKEAEHLCEYDVAYQLGLVIEYNMYPRISGKGSAIFLHVKNKEYTEGCIAISKEDMFFVLNWLSDRNAYFIIF